MVQRLENLEEIVPDGIFGYGTVLFRRLIDDGGKVATAAVFHEDIENSSISINVSVVVLYNVVMMKVLENVSARCRRQSVVKLQELVKTHTSATICFLSRSLILSKLSSLRANICKKDHEPGNTKVPQILSPHQTIRFPSYFADYTKGTSSNYIQRFVVVEESRSHGTEQ